MEWRAAAWSPTEWRVAWAVVADARRHHPVDGREDLHGRRAALLDGVGVAQRGEHPPPRLRH